MYQCMKPLKFRFHQDELANTTHYQLEKAMKLVVIVDFDLKFDFILYIVTYVCFIYTSILIYFEI